MTLYFITYQYHEENGDCKVTFNGPLGRWVSRQRSAKTQTSKILTEKRVELLDNLGFLWSGFPEGRAKAIKGGDPRQNRAIAAKLTYPDLLIRECLHLGGFKNDELDVIKDQKHTWRTRKYLTYTPTWCTILHVCILSSLSLSVTYLSRQYGTVLKYAHEPTERSGSEYFVKG